MSNKKVAFVSGAGEPSAEEKENGSNCLYASLPPPYATVIEDWGRRLQVNEVVYLFSLL